MAQNLSNVLPVILKYGALALREFAIMPRLVNTDYGTEVKQKGNVIDVEIPSAMTANNVVPGTPSVTDVAPTKASIALSNWKDSAFVLSDKESNEIDDKGILVGQASEALKALCNAVDKSIIAKYIKLYGTYGTSGTTPAAVGDIIAMRKLLNKQLAPSNGDRALVIDADAEAAFLALSIFTSRADAGDDSLITGMLGNRLGFKIVNDQNIEDNDHVAGTQNAAYVCDGVQTIGLFTKLVKTGVGTMTEGQIFTVAGDAQQYVITTLYAGGAGTIAFYPAAKVAWAADAAITFKAVTGQNNIAFHRDCFALASRPLDTPTGLGVISGVEIDPISGLALRLEVQRTYKQTRWSWDILWGTECVRRELGTRLIG